MTELDGKPTMTTSELSKRLGVIINVDFMTNELEIPPDVRTKTGSFWLKSKFRFICYEMSQYFYHLNQVGIDGE